MTGILKAFGLSLAAEPLPVELLDARADYAQINDLQMTGRGA